MQGLQFVPSQQTIQFLEPNSLSRGHVQPRSSPNSETRKDSTTRVFRKNLILTPHRSVRTSQALTVICEGCDIVQSDHAHQAGVAQGSFNGDLIRCRDGHQVELEEELEEEVERRVRRHHSRRKTQVHMHG